MKENDFSSAIEKIAEALAKGDFEELDIYYYSVVVSENERKGRLIIRKKKGRDIFETDL